MPELLRKVPFTQKIKDDSDQRATAATATGAIGMLVCSLGLFIFLARDFWPVLTSMAKLEVSAAILLNISTFVWVALGDRVFGQRHESKTTVAWKYYAVVASQSILYVTTIYTLLGR